MYFCFPDVCSVSPYRSERSPHHHMHDVFKQPHNIVHSNHAPHNMGTEVGHVIKPDFISPDKLDSSGGEKTYLDLTEGGAHKSVQYQKKTIKNGSKDSKDFTETSATKSSVPRNHSIQTLIGLVTPKTTSAVDAVTTNALQLNERERLKNKATSPLLDTISKETDSDRKPSPSMNNQRNTITGNGNKQLQMASSPLTNTILQMGNGTMSARTISPASRPVSPIPSPKCETPILPKSTPARDFSEIYSQFAKQWTPGNGVPGNHMFASPFTPGCDVNISKISPTLFMNQQANMCSVSPLSLFLMQHNGLPRDVSGTPEGSFTEYPVPTGLNAFYVSPPSFASFGTPSPLPPKWIPDSESLEKWRRIMMLPPLPLSENSPISKSQSVCAKRLHFQTGSPVVKTIYSDPTKGLESDDKNAIKTENNIDMAIDFSSHSKKDGSDSKSENGVCSTSTEMSKHPSLPRKDHPVSDMATSAANLILHSSHMGNKHTSIKSSHVSRKRQGDILANPNKFLKTEATSDVSCAKRDGHKLNIPMKPKDIWLSREPLHTDMAAPSSMNTYSNLHTLSAMPAKFPEVGLADRANVIGGRESAENLDIEPKLENGTGMSPHALLEVMQVRFYI